MIRFFLVLCLFFNYGTSYHYLVMNPVFGFSHIKIMSKIADILADAGHSVTIFQYYHLPLKNLENIAKNKNIRTIHYYPDDFEEMEKKGVPTFPDLWDGGLFENPILQCLEFPKLLAGEFEKMAKKVLQDRKLHDKLRIGNYDAMVVEAFDTTGFYLADLINIPPIAVLTTVRFQINRLFGEPSTLGYIPEEYSKLGDEANFFDRLNDFYRDTFRTIGNYRIFELQHRINRKTIGRPIDDWKDLLRRSPFLFVNANPYLDYAMPKLENIVNIGGFTFDKNKKVATLPEEYNEILEKRNSTILISFGSVLRSFDMPEKYKSSLVQTFEIMSNITFIWKYEKDDDGMAERVPKNVYLMKWVPQPALLADKRVTLFVTHGGLGSTMEVAYSGKPALMIPLFADQPYNAMMLSRHGGARAYNKQDLQNSMKLIEVIKNMIENLEYNKNAKQLQQILHNQPIDPKDNLLKHMEFSVKFPKLKTLTPENHRIGFTAYYFVDVFLIFASIFVIFLYLVYRLTRHFVYIRKSKTE